MPPKSKEKRELLGNTITMLNLKRLRFLRRMGKGYIGEILDEAIEAHYKKVLPTLDPDELKRAPDRPE